MSRVKSRVVTSNLRSLGVVNTYHQRRAAIANPTTRTQLL